jgi:hypothetical protein
MPNATGQFMTGSGNSAPAQEQAKRPPDFGQTVKVVLTTFAVFTGYTINKAVGAVADKIDMSTLDPSLGFLGRLFALLSVILSTADFWALVALLSLLLRYLIGSAIHLNDTYVKRVAPPAPPLSQSAALLFKDLIFLVVFGIVILSIETTVSGPQFEFWPFAFGCALFLLCGLLWSLIDFVCRWIWGIFRPLEWVGPGAYGLWPILDMLQFFITLGLASLYWPVLSQVRWLALVYVAFLFIDIEFLIQKLRSR